MYKPAKITGYKPAPEGTYLIVLVEGEDLTEPIVEKNMHECTLQLDDGRHISGAQNRKAHATINDIAAYTGEVPEAMKGWLKYRYICQTGGEYFSLKDCSMDTAREFINVILDYALEMGIPLMDFALNRTDDIDHYLYACLKLKKCVICGKHGEVHHVDAIGMGNDRRTLDDSQHRKICLCRIHHTEAHTTGFDSFSNKYKVYGIKFEE